MPGQRLDVRLCDLVLLPDERGQLGELGVQDSGRVPEAIVKPLRTSLAQIFAVRFASAANEPPDERASLEPSTGHDGAVGLNGLENLRVSRERLAQKNQRRALGR